MTHDLDTAATSAGSTAPIPSAATLLLGVALFVPHLVQGPYQGVGRDLPEALPVLGTLLLWTALAAWFTLYCRAGRLPMPMDMGLFLMWAWPVLIPYYLITREGRHGFARIGLFCLTYAAAWAAGTALAIWGRVLLGAE